MSDLPAIDGSLDDESRFYALALRYLDGISTAEEERALCDHFRSVPEDRRRFVTICRQVGMLYETLSAESSEDDLGGVADSSAGPFPAVSIAPSYTQHSFGNVVLSYAASAMILCVALLGAWAYRISHDHESNVVNNSRKSTTFGQHEFVVVGRITGMKDCRWSQTGDPTLLGASVSLDRRYALASGLLEITYKSGARVILEGPCTYRVESSAGGFLERGKLAARVHTKGSGFRVQKSEVGNHKSPNPQPLIPNPFVIRTPTAVVTDLGTEFGVEVDANGDTVSYVFEGKIVVQAGIRGFGDSGEYERELEAGDSVLVKKDATETARFTLPTQTPKFVRQMPELHLPIGLERGLAAYWSFDDPANLGKNSLGGGDLAAEGSPTRETAGALGGALRLRGNGHKDSLSFNGGRGVPSGVPTGDSSYSISAWCRVDAAVLPKGVFDIISWGEPTLGRANALILYGVSPEECMARNFWWDNDIAGNVETASIAGGWHHLATTYDRRGRMQYLYLDGVRIALRGVERRPDFGADHFAIGNRHKSLEPNSPYEWVGGLIDEIGVWDRALSEEEIAELYNNGKGLNPTVASDKTAKGGETERRASE